MQVKLDFREMIITSIIKLKLDFQAMIVTSTMQVSGFSSNDHNKYNGSQFSSNAHLESSVNAGFSNVFHQSMNSQGF